ncbi:MAG: hypothetical protein PHU14_16345 [Methylovulum sp.]|nr:hypothetical protein [Methylovulum sp.]
MKKTVMIGLMMFASGTAMAYDYVDAMAQREIADINAQERADVMHELREGDFREAEQVIRQDEAIKRQVRRQEAMYDRARDRERYNEGYYSRW